MAAMPSDLHVVPLPVPAALDAPDAWLLHGLVDAANATLLDIWGVLDEARRPEETLAGLRHQEYETKLRFVALDAAPADGPPDPARVLGYGLLDLPTQDNTHLGWTVVLVRPEHRGRGVGRALEARVLAAAREHGRTVLTTSIDQAQEPEPGPGTLAPSTGTGRVRTGDPSVAFALRRGWTLEQVARRSVLDVPVDPALLAAHADAAAAVRHLLDAGIRVGALSNAATDYQVRKLTRAGLAADVPLLVGVDTLGFGKPDPRVFAEACRRLGTEPGRTAYVGDELDVDARAATAAGLRGVWLARPGLGSKGVRELHALPTDVVIASLDELPAALGL